MQDATAVRPGEELDWERLERRLREVLPDLTGPCSVLQFANGRANLTYRVTFGERSLVVRRPPFGQLAAGAHDMRREHTALSLLHPVYERAPAALHYEPDPSVIGAEFLVSEYRSGVVIWSAEHIPAPMAARELAGHRIGLAVVDALVDLHNLDIERTGLVALGRPDGYLERQLRGWSRRFAAAMEGDEVAHPAMAGLDETLIASRPVSGRPTVLHNDFKLNNTQFAPDDPDRVVSVFDWDMATVGDPLADLGTLLNYWPDDEGMGLPTRSEVIDRYGAGTDFDVSRANWYEAFGCWKTAVVIRQIYQRYRRGESSDDRVLSSVARIDTLAERARELLHDDRP